MADDGIQRFPRIHRFPRIRRFPRRFTETLPLPAPGHLLGRLAKPLILTEAIKNFVLDISRGEKIKIALVRYGMSQGEYLGLMRKKNFRELLYRETEKHRKEVNRRMERAIVRAQTVMEETLDSDDNKLAFEASKEVLKGRGVLKTTTAIKHENPIEHEHRVILPMEVQQAFVEALIGRFSRSGPVIDMQPLQIRARRNHPS